MNIKELLEESILKLKKYNIEDARLQSKVLLSYVLKTNEQYLIINQNKEVNKENEITYKKYIDKIIDGIPMQYITNNQEFMKLNFYVDENVLIPQPDTEIIVQKVIEIAKDKNIQILDLCTGSGAIAVSLAKYIENSNIVASDISSKAIQIAKLNAEKNLVHKKMEFYISDMFEFEKDINKKFDIIVSNPPYIKTDIIKNLSKQVKNEPHIALDGGQDGLIFYKEIVEEAYKYLNKQGVLLLEIGYDQRKDVISLLKESNKYENIECIKDLSENDRVIIAKLK